MIRRLAKLNLVHYVKHRGVTLTSEGERIALEVLRHHRLIEAYLIEALGFTWDEVHEEADILEHVISEKLEERIAAALGNPQFDPHGAPIPTKDLTVPVSVGRNLTTLTLNTPAIITRILHDDDRELLRHLTELGITLNAQVQIIDKAPFDGHFTLCINDTIQTIGFQVATAILVNRQ
jgi:DtxR family Mn-dependent transcriptional regulator